MGTLGGENPGGCPFPCLQPVLSGRGIFLPEQRDTEGALHALTIYSCTCRGVHKLHALHICTKSNIDTDTLYEAYFCPSHANCCLWIRQGKFSAQNFKLTCPASSAQQGCIPYCLSGLGCSIIKWLYIDGCLFQVYRFYFHLWAPHVLDSMTWVQCRTTSGI